MFTIECKLNAHSFLHMSCVMRKPFFLMQKQRRRSAPSFRYIDNTITLLSESEISSLCGCTAWFVLDLVENPKDRFSHDAAHIWPPFMRKPALYLCEQQRHRSAHPHGLMLIVRIIYEPRHEKTNVLYMPKQRRRSASR